MHHSDDIGDLIRAARSGRTDHMIAPSIWPGGGADQTRPAAREWLRRWNPRHPVSGADIPGCGCASGRCAICN
jgi:hypothetical protein